jgi:hypothetical protein
MTRSMTAKDLKAALAANDAALRASLGRLIGGAGQPARRAGQDLGQDLAGLGASAVDSARAHPWATAALGAGGLGAGIAWLALSGRRRKAAPLDPKAEALARWEDEGGQPVDVGDIEAVEAEVEDWMIEAAAARDAARDRLLALFEAGRATAETRAEVAADLAQDLAAAFRHNLADLTEDTAARVTEARKAAWDAMEKSRDLARDGYRRGKTAARRHPVAATALGLTVGAGLLAALSPRSRPLIARAAAPVALSALLAQGLGLLLRQDRPAEKAEELAQDLAEDLEKGVKTARKTVSAKAKKAKTAVKSATKSAPKAARTRAGAPAGKAAPSGPAEQRRPNGAVAH